MDVSIIVPVYNNPFGVRETVCSFVRQDYIGEYEIIVVDNNSTDHTPQEVNDLAERFPCVTALKESCRGSYAARNRGITEASGDILCFADADTSVGCRYLTTVVAHFETGHVDYLGVRVNLTTKTQSLADKYERIFSFPIKNYMEQFHFAPTCCLSVKKSVLEDVGSFDSHLESGGDKEFGQRVYSAGYVMKYADEIVVHHPARSTRPELFNKARRIGRGIAQQYFYHPATFGDHYKACFSPLNLLRVKIVQVFVKNRERETGVSALDCCRVACLEWQLRIVGACSTFVAYRQMKSSKRL